MTNRLALRPLSLSGFHGSPPDAQVLAGGWRTFSAVEAVRHGGREGVRREVMPLSDLSTWAANEGIARETEEALSRLSAPRSRVAGLSMTEPRLMGIVNCTPDSFSDGGEYLDPGRAVEAGLAMHEAGAAVIDVGGESTRPGAGEIDIEEELKRILPVVRGLAARGCRVSIDTRRARVMNEALDAGAVIVNDVTALTGDPESLKILARAVEVPVILMHMQGEPQTMQRAPAYEDAASDIWRYLAERIEACELAGIERQRIVVDPGIGFGKTLAHNLELLDQIGMLHSLGVPILLGASRKSFIARLSRGEPANERLPGSLAAMLAGVARGVQMIRVHDVAESWQAISVWRSIDCREKAKIMENS